MHPHSPISPVRWLVLLACLAGIAAAGAGSGCTTQVQVTGTTSRTLEGQLQVAPLAPTVDFTQRSIHFFTRGGHFSSGILTEDGAFLLPIPRHGGNGLIVLARVSTTLDKLLAVATLVNGGTPDSLLQIEPGTDNLVIPDPIDVDTTAEEMRLTGALPVGLSFTAAPYVVADLCADDQATSCAMSDALACDPGPCGSAIAADTILSMCAPCSGLTDFTGPFFPGMEFLTSDESVDPDQDPLPDLFPPFPGLALTNLIISLPAQDVGGTPVPPTTLNVGALMPALFYEDLTDRTSYRIRFEDGQRFSADNVIGIAVPDLPAGSTEKIYIRYETTAGNLMTVRCACDNPSSECTYSPTCP